MKTNLMLILLCMAATQTLAQTMLNVDIKNSTLNWTGHAEVGSYAPAGMLLFKSGMVTLTGDKVTNATLVIDMQSMQQENTNLLNHLKSEDFFGVEKFPVSTVVITSVTNGIAYGKLTVKNKTQPLQCPITVKKTTTGIIITGSTTIDRTAYGITYNSGSFFSGLGDKAIRNTFEITFNIVASQK